MPTAARCRYGCPSHATTSLRQHCMVPRHSAVNLEHAFIPTAVRVDTIGGGHVDPLIRPPGPAKRTLLASHAGPTLGSSRCDIFHRSFLLTFRSSPPQRSLAHRVPPRARTAAQRPPGPAVPRRWHPRTVRRLCSACRADETYPSHIGYSSRAMASYIAFSSSLRREERQARSRAARGVVFGLTDHFPAPGLRPATDCAARRCDITRGGAISATST